MMTQFSIITRVEVKEFVESLDRIGKARIDRIYDAFEQYGPFLPAKYLKKIERNLWELRPGDVRLFFTMKGSQAIVVHSIHKKSQKTPKRDLELARKRVAEELRV